MTILVFNFYKMYPCSQMNPVFKCQMFGFHPTRGLDTKSQGQNSPSSTITVFSTTVGIQLTTLQLPETSS